MYFLNNLRSIEEPNSVLEEEEEECCFNFQGVNVSSVPQVNGP